MHCLLRRFSSFSKTWESRRKSRWTACVCYRRLWSLSLKIGLRDFEDTRKRLEEDSLLRVSPSEGLIRNIELSFLGLENKGLP